MTVGLINLNCDQQVSKWCTGNHLWLADWCHQWLNVYAISDSMLIVCADILSQYLFLGCCTCMQSVILWSFLVWPL